MLEYPGGPGGGMTAAQYREQVLESVLWEFWQDMSKERGEVFFQQDGASAHRAKVTKAWLKSKGIKIFPHPACSPNLNPIEHLWHLLKEIIWGLNSVVGKTLPVCRISLPKRQMPGKPWGWLANGWQTNFSHNY